MRYEIILAPEAVEVGSDIRVFYDVDAAEYIVSILAIVNKADANQWLEQHGETDEKSGPV